LQYKSKKRTRKSNNSRTKETSKQKKPKKLNVRKEKNQEKSIAFNINQYKGVFLELIE
jgi:hypothetical protein